MKLARSVAKKTMASAISSAVAGRPAGAWAASCSSPSPIASVPSARRSGAHYIDADTAWAVFSGPHFGQQIALYFVTTIARAGIDTLLTTDVLFVSLSFASVRTTAPPSPGHEGKTFDSVLCHCGPSH